jgi:hypothetical protein
MIDAIAAPVAMMIFGSLDHQIRNRFWIVVNPQCDHKPRTLLVDSAQSPLEMPSTCIERFGRLTEITLMV